MANTTWNKIKNKFKWKSARNRPRNRRRNKHKKHSNNNNNNSNNSNRHRNIRNLSNSTITPRSSPHFNTTPHSILSPITPITPNTVNTVNTPRTNIRSIKKKSSRSSKISKSSKSSKSNIFGCLTTTPKDLKHYNTQQQPPSVHSAPSEYPTTSTFPHPHKQIVPQFTNERKSSHSSESTSPQQPQHEQLDHHEHVNISSSSILKRPFTPSKSQSAFIKDNVSIIDTESVKEASNNDHSPHHGHHREHHGHRNNNNNNVGMTPTPQTGITSYASSSEYNHIIHDIYDGVIEVENSKIIEEGDLSNFCYDDESIKHEPEPSDDEDDDDDDDMEQQHRDSVIIKSPRDIVDEFAAVSNMTQNGTTSQELEIGLSAASIEVSVDNALDVDVDDGDIYQGIIREQEFMEQLNEELRRNGYEEPELILQELWDEQLEIDRGAQILKILKHFVEKKNIKLADNFMLNHGEYAISNPMIPAHLIPIDRVDAVNYLYSQQQILTNPHQPTPSPKSPACSLSNNSEDDDIKQQHHEHHEHHHHHDEYPEYPQYAPSPPLIEVSPQQLILDKMIKSIGTGVENEYIPHHDGPLHGTTAITATTTTTATTKPTTTTSAKTSSSPSSMTRTGISRRSGSSISEEPEYYDGDLFHEKYKVGGRINEGGFGTVWKINDNNLYRKCVKIMDLGKDEHSQTRRRKACIREFQMTAKAFSDEIVEVELYIDNTQIIMDPKAYLIMPYFEGQDLFEFIDDDNYLRKCSIKTMLNIFYKIAEELYDLHYYKKIVHGDLKPENVMILQNHQTNEMEVEIIDYGIAKSIKNLSSDKKYLKSKGHFGTKGYVAPELMRDSRYNRKIDVFSAGVVLYNMVTECCLFPKGHRYYRLSERDYYKYLKRKFKVIKKKKPVVDILYSCLSYDPDERLDVKQLIERYFHSRR